MPTPAGWTFVAAYNISTYGTASAARRAAAKSIPARTPATHRYTIRPSDSGLSINLYAKARA